MSNELQEDDSLVKLRQKFRDQLEKSGMNDVIKKLVADICNSIEDPLSINADEVLQTIYKRGVMTDVIEQFDTLKIKSSQPQMKMSNANVESMMLKLDSDLSCFNTISDGESKLFNLEVNDDGKIRYFLKMELLGGKAFLDHLSHEDPSGNCSQLKSQLLLHIFYKSQRFVTKPVDCRCDPHFRDVFMIDIGQFSCGSVSELLAVKEPLKIVIIREDVNLNTTGGGMVISYTLHDWRSVLLTDNGFETFSLELMGTGLENNVPVGLLNTKISLLPTPEEQVSENTFLSQMQIEKTSEQEKSRAYISTAKHWLRDFLSLRPTNIFRNVKLLAYDDKMISRPVMTFVKPMNNADRHFLTPFHAAWFVALFSGDKMNDISMPKCGISGEKGTNVHWQTLESTIASKQGGVEDRSVLLCSLLLGFGCHAFVAFGSKKGKNTWAFTVTFDNSYQPTFWETTTGKQYKHIPEPEMAELPEEKVNRMKKNDTHKFRSIACLFNNDCLYANIQASDSINLISWDISDQTKWKQLHINAINTFPLPSYSPGLLISCLDCTLIEKNIEIELKQLIKEARLMEGLTTVWDDSISRLMGQQLAAYELEASTGASHVESLFEVAVLKRIPFGYDFKGFPFHNQSTNPKQIFYACMRNHGCHEVVYCRGEDVQLSLRAISFSYPENLVSLRLMIACKFIAIN